MKISDPLIFMVFPWGSYKSSYNGQDIEYLLKNVRICGKFNVFLTPCVMAWLETIILTLTGPLIGATTGKYQACVEASMGVFRAGTHSSSAED